EFPLGTYDKPSCFDVPQKLYGREHEKKQLLEAFDRVSIGGAELLLVSGTAGIGKSFFINEIHKPIVVRHGYFASGKFDQYRRNIPYDALIQVFRSLVRQLLTEDQERLALWRHNLNQAFGENGAVLTDVIPELELIVGAQPPVPELDPIPTQNRFNRYLLLMLQVLATEEHPIVAFLDDLHWGDAASLQLLQTILNAADVRHLLLIGAYRSEELTETHPFRAMLQALKRPPAEIRLRPFMLGPIQQIVSDTIHQSGTHVAELAQVVEEKTHGNPFFVNEFLNNLYDKKLLTFNFESGKWQWDLKEIRAVGTTDNVVDLLTHKIQQLSAAEQEALQWGACLGGEFTLALYADVRQQSRTEAAVTLWSAVKEGLLILIGDPHRLAQDSQINLQNISNLDISYQFAHDRVQQAAYLLIEAAQLAQMHYQIGRRRLDAHTAEELDNALFDVVNQLNQGLEMVTDVAEKREIAHLNLQAGQKAQAAIAFKAAADYYYIARDLLPDNYWQTDYQLALDIYNGLFVCEYLNGRFEEADALFSYIQQHAQSALDIVQTYSTRVYMLQNLDKNDEAVDTALLGLQELGIKLSKKPSVLQILAKAIQVWRLLRGRELEKLIDREEAVDPQQLAILAIFSRLATASYFISREFTIYINLARMVTALQFKNTPSTGHAFVAFGFVMAAGLGRYEYGERLGHVGTEVSKRYLGEVAGDHLVYDGMTRPWVRPLRDCMPYLQEAYQKLLNSGEILTPVYVYQLLTMQMVFHSVPLSHIENELPTYRKTVELSQDPSAIHYLAVLERFLMALRGETESPTSLSDDEFSEDELLHKIKTGNMPVILHRYYIHKLHLHYLFGEYEEAQAIAEASAEVLDAGFGIMVYLAEHHFYHALTL
ncbi:MAG: DUF2791 family P-loop domain-containing protein, partial [Anaerolineales bacterium]|nr:DUF2791 family P-loop domain-containing protein [Anaerolineales bacterium]